MFSVPHYLHLMLDYVQIFSPMVFFFCGLTRRDRDMPPSTRTPHGSKSNFLQAQCFRKRNSFCISAAIDNDSPGSKNALTTSSYLSSSSFSSANYPIAEGPPLLNRKSNQSNTSSKFKWKIFDEHPTLCNSVGARWDFSAKPKCSKTFFMEALAARDIQIAEHGYLYWRH